MFNTLFEIGDYSCDGHNFFATFLVKSNKTAQELQNVHMKENEFIGSLCSEYEQDYIYIYELYKFLLSYMTPEKALEFLNAFAKEADTEVLIENEDEVEQMSVEEEEYHTFHMYSPTAMLEMWLRLLKVVDNSVEYEIISEPMSSYMIKYKGYPEKPDGEMIPRQYSGMKVPGYGVWDGDGDMEFCHM